MYVFRQETQKSSENITEFYPRLQLLARKCEFASTELEIKRQVIQGTSSIRLRRKAIEQTFNLENLLKAARAMGHCRRTNQRERKTAIACSWPWSK